MKKIFFLLKKFLSKFKKKKFKSDDNYPLW